MITVHVYSSIGHSTVGKSQRHKCCTNPHPTLLYYPLLRNPKYWPYFSLTISLTKLLAVISVGQIIYYLVKYHYGNFFCIPHPTRSIRVLAIMEKLHSTSWPANRLPTYWRSTGSLTQSACPLRLRTSRTGSVFADWQRPHFEYMLSASLLRF